MKSFAIVATCLVTCFLLCSFQQETSPSQPKPGQKVATTNEQKAGSGKEPHSNAPTGQPAASSNTQRNSTSVADQMVVLSQKVEALTDRAKSEQSSDDIEIQRQL